MTISRGFRWCYHWSFSQSVLKPRQPGLFDLCKPSAQLIQNPSPNLFVRRCHLPQFGPDGFRSTTVESVVSNGVSAFPIGPVDPGLNVYDGEGFVSLDVVVCCLQASTPDFSGPILISENVWCFGTR